MNKIRLYLKYIKRLFLLEKSHTYITITSIAVGVAILGATLILGQSISDSAIKSAQIIHGGDLVAIGLSEPFTTKFINKANELKVKGEIKDFTVRANMGEITRSKDKSSIANYLFIDEKNYPLYGPPLRSIKPENILVKKLLRKGVIVSEKIADKFDLKMGDKLKLGLEPKQYKVAGIIGNVADTGMDARMMGFIIRPMIQYEQAIKYSQNKGQKNANKIVSLKLNKSSDIYKIREIMQKNAAAFTYLQPITDVAKQIKSQMDVFKKGLASFGYLSLLLVGVGISYAARLWARRRLRDIAILKAVGLKINDIKLLFTLALTLFLIIGTVLGTLLSFAIVLLLKGPVQQFFGVNASIGWFYPKEIMLATFSTFLAVIGFSSFSISVLSKTLPSISLRAEEGSFPRLSILNKLLAAIFSTVILIAAAFIIVKDLLIASMLVPGILLGGGLILLLLRLIFTLLPLNMPFGNNYKLAVKSLKSQGWLVPRTALVVLVGILFLSLVFILAKNIELNLKKEIHRITRSDAMVVIRAENNPDKIYKAPNLKSVIVGQMAPLDIVAINGSKTRLLKLKNNINLGKKGYDPYIFEVASSISLVDPLKAQLQQDISKGRKIKASDNNKRVVVLSNRVAQGLKVKLGETLDIKSSGKVIALKIIGILVGNSVISGLDELTAPVNALPKIEKKASFYYLDFKAKKAESSIKWLNKNLKDALVLDISDLASSFGNAVDSVKTFPLMISLLSLFASVVIIWSSITFSVIQRKRELAILKALGAKSKKIIWLLVNENLIVGAIGGITALVIVGIMTNVATENMFKSPAKFNYFSLLGLLLIAVSIAVLSGILPAIRVARSKPSEVLRNE